jgi:hypothetical protein
VRASQVSSSNNPASSVMHLMLLQAETIARSGLLGPARAVAQWAHVQSYFCGNRMLAHLLTRIRSNC